jgi:hypothetical protein
MLLKIAGQSRGQLPEGQGLHRRPLGEEGFGVDVGSLEAKIEEWLAEDRRMRFKQRHTAKCSTSSFWPSIRGVDLIPENYSIRNGIIEARYEGGGDIG